MWRRLIAVMAMVAMPGAAAAGPLEEAFAKAGKELALAQAKPEERSRGRFWSGIALLAAGGALTAMGAVELSEDETGAESSEPDDLDNGDDSDNWEKVMLGGGIAAAAVGGLLLMTGRRSSNPVVVARPGKLTVRHTIRF